MHLYFNKRSATTTIFSLFMSESFPACFSCSNNFTLSHNSFGSDYKKFVFRKLFISVRR